MPRTSLHPRARLAARLAAICLVTALVAVETIGATEFTLAPLWTTGGTGGGTGEYGVPESVAIDSLGQVVATDKGRMMLHVYSAADGRALFDVGGLGTVLGKFDRPNGIAIDGAGRVLVVEQRNQRVQILDRDYRTIGSFGTSGAGLGRFQKPMGIALDAAGLIYITDEARADVQVFDPTGRPLRVLAENPRLARVESIEVDRQGERLLVCDESQSRVNVYDMEGRFLSSFGEQGTGPGEFGNDTNAVRLDAAGRIYINDQGNSRINVYRRDTSFLASFKNTGRAMESADGLALSEAHDLLIVADQGNDRLIAWELGEIQCRLSRIERQATAGTLIDLRARIGDRLLETGGLGAWPGAVIDFEARAASAGDPARVEMTVLHVRTQADRGGICVAFEETGAATNVFQARLQLASTSDAASGQLAARSGDALRAHVPDTDEITIEIDALPPLTAQALQVVQGAAQRRITTDHPLFGWRFVDPAGVRTQTGYRMRLLHPSGWQVWESFIQPGDASEHRYDGAPLPQGVPLTLTLSVASGSDWSPEVAIPVQRNAPPTVRAFGPANGTRMHDAPIELIAASPVDADGDRLRVTFELWMPDGSIERRSTGFALDGTLRCSTQGIVLHENDRLRWRLRADDGWEPSGTPWSSLLRNDIEERPGPAALLEPQDGQARPIAPVQLTWSAAVDPDPESRLRYTIEWSLDASFASPLCEDAGEATSFEARGPARLGEHHWRVRVTDPTGHETWSAARRIRFENPVRPPASRDAVTPAGTRSPFEPWPMPLRRGARLQMASHGTSVAFEIFDVRGRRVRQARTSPDGAWVWDALDDAGRELAPGVYLARLRTPHAPAAPAAPRKVLWLGD